MQQLVDYQSLSVFITILLSAIVGLYLIHIWRCQQNRLFSDLSLVFGITFVGHAINNFVRFLPSTGLVVMSLELFKIRAAIILATVLPIMAALLQIWWPRGRKYHTRVLVATAIYWLSVVAISPSIELILLLCIPLVLVTTVSLTATFAITWKTHRLREVRSDLMVVSLIFATIGQIVATDIIINSLCNAVSTVIAGIALVNPWRQHGMDGLPSSEMETYPMAQGSLHPGGVPQE